MTKRVLITWIGFSDLDAKAKQERGDATELGPVLRMLVFGKDRNKEHLQFDHIYLLHDFVPAPQNRQTPAEYMTWLRNQVAQRRNYSLSDEQVKLRPASRNLRNEMQLAYEFTRQQLGEIRGEHPAAEFSCLLTPGYPTCQFAMLLSSRTVFGGQVELYNTLFPKDSPIHIPDDQSVERVTIPFSLYVDMRCAVMSGLPADLDGVQVVCPELLALKGSSAQMTELRRISHLLATNYPHWDILITGPMGTGKTELAEAIHRATVQAHTPDFADNFCRSDTFAEELIDAELFGYGTGVFTGQVREGREGLFESAKKGTVFLDEVANLPIGVQQKLLDVLQNRRVRRVGENQSRDVQFRLIAATNKNLQQLVEEGRFIPDLYARLRKFELRVPSLNERREDIPEIADALLARQRTKAREWQRDLDAKPPRLTEPAKSRLCEYHWPENVRQLDGVLAKATFSATPIDEVTEERIAAVLANEPQRDRRSSGFSFDGLQSATTEGLFTLAGLLFDELIARWNEERELPKDVTALDELRTLTDAFLFGRAARPDETLVCKNIAKRLFRKKSTVELKTDWVKTGMELYFSLCREFPTLDQTNWTEKEAEFKRRCDAQENPRKQGSLGSTTN